MSFGVCLFLQGVIRKYGRKAHALDLHRDINVPRNFLSSRRLQKPPERPPSPLGRPPWYKHQSQNGVHHYKDLGELIEMHILFAIFGVRNQEILIRRTAHKRATGLIGPKSDFGPLRPMCILMRYGGKFSTTLPAEPKRHKGGGIYKQTPWPLEENKFIIELRGALEGIPLL